MTSSELVDIYLAHMGLRRVKGTGYDPILPVFMLDAMYQIMTTDIKTVESRFEQKRALKRWNEAYNIFNQDFFSCFKKDSQRDEIIDMMDAFEAYIQNDIIIAEVAVMNELQRYGIPFEHQKVLSSCMMCHVLAQSALVLWDTIYKGFPNQYIKTMIKNAGIWMNLYFSKLSQAHVDPNASDSICTAVDILCRKMVKFLSTLKK